MLIGDLINSGAIPALEMTAKFAAARQTLIAHNIANIDTPDFIPTDLSPTDFQRAMRDAVERRRARTGGETGDLEFKSTDQVHVASDGRIVAKPRPAGGMLLHDRNNRDVERLMQSNAENVSAFRVSTELLRSRYALLTAAIEERP